MPSLSDFLKEMPLLDMDDQKKKILLLHLLAFAVIVVAYAMFFLKPTLVKLGKITPKVRELRTDMGLLKDTMRFEDTLKARLRKSRTKIGTYETEISRKKEIPILLQDFSDMAKSSRVKILGVTPVENVVTGKKSKRKKAAPVQKSSIFQEVPIKINARGGYHQLGSFISKLETGPRFMAVSDIKITSNSTNQKLHDIEFVILVYTLKKE